MLNKIESIISERNYIKVVHLKYVKMGVKSSIH